jgi:hypothetical protein
MTLPFTKNQTFRRVYYFFPLQLLLLHLRNNQLLLLFWILLTGFVCRWVGVKYGVPYLLLDPEYLGKVNYWSYFILGFSCGGFIMAFHLASYIANSFRFHFLATLSRPFYKYCVNNSFIPLVFIIIYLWQIISFEYENEMLSNKDIFLNSLGFIVGIALFILTSLSYFFSANKDISHLFGISVNDNNEVKANRNFAKPIRILLKKNKAWREHNQKRIEPDDWEVETYLVNPFKLALARETNHYDRTMLRDVFRQNHFTGILFVIIALLSFFIIGAFREYPIFQVPAGASIFLILTMLLMVASAIQAWLRKWSVTFFIALILLINFLSGNDFFNHENKAYGLNYKSGKAEFSYQRLEEFNNNKENFESDFAHTISILDKWRKKNTAISKDKNTIKKPKLIILSCSGGGQRASAWTFYSMQHIDSLMQGNLLKHTQLIVGSSGGMLGSAYLRELMLRQQTDSAINIHSQEYYENICRDLLNPIAFSYMVNDMFIRFQKFNDGKKIYTKDRGYAFEKQLHENTGNLMNKRIKDYALYEKEAIIPMMFLTPTIINDGRLLYISSQPTSYMCTKETANSVSNPSLPDGIEFRRFFEQQGADSLWFSSALRMNCTFPYIAPVVTLPSEPAIEIMDAGFRDNYGMSIAIKYLHTFRNWISTNTSGVIIIQTRDTYKKITMENKVNNSLINIISNPVGNIYSNMFNMQDFNHDQLIQYAGSWFDAPIDVIDLQLKSHDVSNISMSWHLTSKEKIRIRESVKLPENQQAISKLKQLLQ